MHFTRHPELKITLTQAEDEAREHSHRAIGPDHLIVAMLTNVRGRTYRLLTEHGLDYPTAGARLVDFHASHPDSDAPDTSAEDLERDREALRAIGIDLDSVRDAVQSRFGVDLADRWGERRPARDRRRGGGRRRGRHGDHECHEHAHGGGRRGPRSRRRGRPRFTSSLQHLTDQVGNDLKDRLETAYRDGSRGRGPAEQVLDQLPLMVLSAILRSDDPAVAAVLGDTDLDALRHAVEEQLGATVA